MKKEEFKVIKCSRCGVPNSYGSAHICDEVDVAEHNLKANPKIKEWFKRGLRKAEA